MEELKKWLHKKINECERHARTSNGLSGSFSASEANALKEVLDKIEEIESSKSGGAGPKAAPFKMLA